MIKRQNQVTIAKYSGTQYRLSPFSKVSFMQNKTIAVFTPTYNRAYKLPDLYNALKRQTSKDFVWIVVDDGSTDNTRTLIAGYTEEAEFEIRYIFQKKRRKTAGSKYGFRTLP